MVVMPGPGRGPARHALLSPEGDVVGPLGPFDDLHVLADSGLSDDFVPHPTDDTIAHLFSSWDGTTPATMSVRILDARGRTLRSFDDVAPGNGAVATPSITFADDGRLFVAWHDVADDSTRNFVFVRELGCPP